MLARIGGWIVTGRIWAHARAWMALRLAAWRLDRSGRFDARWYRAAYPDISGHPALHFLRRGQAEGRLPLPVDVLPHPHLSLTDANYRIWLAASGDTSRGADGVAEQVPPGMQLILPPGMVLAPGGLAALTAVLTAAPEVDMVYADEDRIDPDGRRHTPWFKPDWDPILAETCDLTGGAALVRRKALARVPGPATPHVIGSAVGPDRIRHIPSVLFHRVSTRSPVPTSSCARPSLHAQRPKIPAQQFAPSIPAFAGMMRGSMSGADMANPVHSGPEEAGATPLVSVIVPTRDRASLLMRCVHSILHRTDYPAIELIIIDNGSRRRRTARFLKQVSRDPRVRVLHRPGAFNWSALNNDAVQVARGDVIVLLNNDVEATFPDWLRQMVRLVLRPDIGVVGAHLLYPDGTVQHAGITLAPGAVATHLMRGAAPDDMGHGGMLCSPRSVAAVTGACMAFRRDVFDAVGGLEPTQLAITHNDIDLCLRVRARGWRVVCTPHVTLIHHEAATRGAEQGAGQRARVMRERAYLVRTWGRLAEHDPYLSPNLAVVNGELLLAAPSPRGTIAREHGGDPLDVGQEIGRQPGGNERGAADIQRIGQATETFRNGGGDGLVGADGGEQRDNVIGDLGGHPGPLPGLGHGIQLAAEVTQPV